MANDVAEVGRASGADSVMAGMHDSLGTLIKLIERVAPGMRGSVLLLDEDGVTLRHASAPNLPAEYCRLIDGERIGPAAGSCGTAAYRGEQVIVHDIASDPLWANYRAAAEPFGLAACWSTPILDPQRRVLGTFAMYYSEPRGPTATDLALAGTASTLAASIIQGARAEVGLRASEAQLRASRDKQRAALDASSTSTWRWDMDTSAVECDDGLFRLFGIDPASASGSFDIFVSRIHDEDRDRVIAAALRCASDGVDLDEEFRVVHPDGSVRWLVDKGKPVFDDEGKPRFLIGSCSDVTERRMREQQIRALAESLPQHAWMADRQGWIYWYNQRWYEYTGTTLEEMQGWGWQQIHHPDHVARVLERIQWSWDTGEPWEDTFPLRGRDGRYRWFLSRALPIRDVRGDIVRWFGTNTDITTLREAEEARDRALAEAKTERERLYEVVMQAPAAITVLEGPDHIFTVANPLYFDTVGKRDILGKSMRDALPELAGQGMFELLDEVYSSGETYSARERLVWLDSDGDGVPEEHYFDFVYQPLKNSEGNTFGILLHAMDLSVQVQAREEIAAARAEAERANKAKSQFLAAMSHDLRTPLNAIGGFAELTAEGIYGPVTDDQRRVMSRIQQAGNHLLSLINDILSFARIEAGRVQLNLSATPVDQIVADAAALIELQARKKGLSFAAPAGTGIVQVCADGERVIQILTNLLTNAVKFTESGSITVGWHADDRAVSIEVRDTGRGIPADKLAAIFEPFVQAGRSAEEQQQGVGLGLAISRELARAMGGDLTVASVAGTGSSFTLTLPRAADAVNQES